MLWFKETLGKDSGVLGVGIIIAFEAELRGIVCRDPVVIEAVAATAMTLSLFPIEGVVFGEVVELVELVRVFLGDGSFEKSNEFRQSQGIAIGDSFLQEAKGRSSVWC